MLNVTPDSFSDGGNFLSATSAVAHAQQLIDDGADVVEVGGESTRPNAQPVSAEAEIRRVVPVVEAILAARPDARVAVDTVKSDVARAAVAAGASVLNDVSALRLDPEIADVCADADCTLVLMHSRGTVENMARYEHAEYDDGDVASGVVSELSAAVTRAIERGVPHERIVLDPGLGFSKRSEHSVAALAQLPRLVELGFPVMVGPSRKRFIGEITGVSNPSERDAGNSRSECGGARARRDLVSGPRCAQPPSCARCGRRDSGESCVTWVEVAVLAAVILFQPEVRGIFYRLRYPRTVRFLRRVPRVEVAEEIVDAVDRLSRSSHGAIIVLEQEMSLGDVAETGTELQANVSSDLLVTIFTPYTPLHDGAVIIRDVVLVSAGCILPLSQSPLPDRTLGTRHRAAVGLSEETDALVVVVSEENASISVAHKGQLYRALTTLELRDILGGQMPRHTTEHVSATAS